MLLGPKLFFWETNLLSISFLLSYPIPPNRGSSGAASPMLCQVQIERLQDSEADREKF